MSEKKRRQVEILGVKVDSTTIASVLRQVRVNIKNKEKFLIVTPNPEIVLASESDPELAKILNTSDISLPDGVGLLAANRFLSLPNPKDKVDRLLTLLSQGLGVGFSIVFNREWVAGDLNIIRGREMFLELIALANKLNYRVFLIGGEYAEAEKAKTALKKNYTFVNINAAAGPIVDKAGSPVDAKQKEVEKETVQEINEFKPHLVFVGMGAPKQEKWTYRWLPNLEVGGAMVVGGTFRYVSGQRKWPPKWIADRGLEWLWRLVTGSQKRMRIKVAIWHFPIRVFWEKFTQR